MKPFRLCSILALALLVAGVFFAGAQQVSAQSAGSKSNWTPNSTKKGASLGPDLYKVNYFSNANTTGAPDGTVRLTDPGTSAGNVCAQIYVFDPQQEMSECCACLLTPDGLRTLSVNTDLTHNPLTGVVLTTGTVAVVSGLPLPGNVCDPRNNIVEPAVRAWGTHIQNASFAVTETEYSDVQLTANNNNLLLDCNAIYLDGSGHGICSCGTGD